MEDLMKEIKQFNEKLEELKILPGQNNLKQLMKLDQLIQFRDLI